MRTTATMAKTKINKPALPSRADWEAVERDYRAGTLSIREVAKKHGLSDTGVRKKATVQGWERNLSSRVNEQVRVALVRNTGRTANPQSEQEIIDNATDLVVGIVQGQQKRIAKQTALVDFLTDQLLEAAQNRPELEAEIEEQTKDDRSGERRSRLLRAVSLPTHTSAAVNLTNAMKSLVGMERQAYNISDTTAPENPLDSLLRQVSGSALPVVIESQEE